MDWVRAIEINQTALTRIVAGLIAMVGFAAQGAVARLPRPLYRAALRILRPAEAAVRRLIIIAARGVVVNPRPVRPMPKGLALAGKGGSRVSFQLFDTRKRFDIARPKRIPDHKVPRIWTVGDDAPPRVPIFRPEDFGRPVPETPVPEKDDSVDASRLGRRLQAIKRALEDLPRQAKRLVRWQMRRKAMKNPKFTSPLRPGPPPGHRKKPKDEVDLVLKECHALAWDALREDSS